MAIYTYEGPGTSLSIAGRTLDRGQPTVLEGRAAESAANHPDIHEQGSVEAKPVTLGRMNHAQLLALAAERGVAVADDATNAEIRAELEAQAS
jgi:hypothetical protein